MRYLPLTQTDRQAMLATIGAASIDDLFVDVPAEARLSGPVAGLPDHASEMAVERHFSALARQNMAASHHPFFLGCGAYKHHIPASVDHLIQRGEFLTAYTPYQPEIAQGTLQMLFEFQTQVARLLGCDVANASMYDGSTACWEAISMAGRITKRKNAILSSGLHPHYVSLAKTMAKFTGDTLDTAAPELSAKTDNDRLLAAVNGETSCVVVQYPDILGRIEDLSAIAAKAHEHGHAQTGPQHYWPDPRFHFSIRPSRALVFHCWQRRNPFTGRRRMRGIRMRMGTARSKWTQKGGA